MKFCRFYKYVRASPLCIVVFFLIFKLYVNVCLKRNILHMPKLLGRDDHGVENKVAVDAVFTHVDLRGFDDFGEFGAGDVLDGMFVVFAAFNLDEVEHIIFKGDNVDLPEAGVKVAL